MLNEPMLNELTEVRRTRIGAVDVMAMRERDVVDVVSTGWSRGIGGSIVTANVDIARAASRRSRLADLIAVSEIVVADGMPIVWASRLCGGPVPERVTGSSLVYSLTEAACRSGQAVYLLGGDSGVPEAAAASLADRCPGLRVAGVDSPPFGFDTCATTTDAVVARVACAGPGLVLVGLGCPKQEQLIGLLRVAHPRAWYLGCGAGIAIAAGQFRRAPAAMQRIGAEWLHRLALEPRRLARRYLWDDAPYAVYLLATAGTRGLLRSAGGWIGG